MHNVCNAITLWSFDKKLHVAARLGDEMDHVMRNFCGFKCTVLEKKRCLVTAIRRRSRVVDEVWRCYLALHSAHTSVRNGQGQIQDSGTSFQTARCSLSRNCTGGDVDNALRAQRSSCIDFLSSTLIRCGMELELYDDETQGLSRVGVGVGLAAVVIAICAVAYYY